MSNGMDVILFDTETTGLIKPKSNDINAQPYITEIYCLKIRQQNNECIKIDEFEHLFKVPVKLSADISRITGLTDEDLMYQPKFKNCFEDLAKFFNGTERMVAHNLPFDRSMLANELVRIDKVINFPWPRQHVCTVEKSMKYEQRRLSLKRLHEELFGTGFDDAHRAKNDVEALYRCYKEMVRKGDIL